MARKPKNHDPVFRVHQVGWNSTNSGRRMRGMEPLSFEDYMRMKSSGEVMQGKERVRKVVGTKPRAERDYTEEWLAENVRRMTRGQLPLKYDDYVRDWRGWV